MTERFRLRGDISLEEGNFIFEDWEMGPRIGTGNSSVYEVKHKTTREIRALKEFVISSESAYENIKKEIEMLQLLMKYNNDFYIKYYDYCIVKEVVDEYNTVRTAYILMEKGKTNLDTLIKKRKETILPFFKYN